MSSVDATRRGRLGDRAREWFLLRDLEARAEKVPAEVRDKTARALALSAQRRGAAEALWIAGFPADALRLLIDALALARGALTEAGLEAKASPIDAPALDSEVTKEHAAEFRALLAEHSRLVAGHQELALDKRGIAQKRVMRAAATAAAALAAVFAVYYLVRTPRVLKATASAMWDQRYQASNAVDGNDATDWVLPDRTPGWIEVQVIPPRKVARLKLLNARNTPYNDRSTHEFKVEAFSKGQVVKTADGRFEAFSAEPTWRTVEIGAASVDRIRIEVKTWHLSGGGFGEIEVD